MTSVPRTQRRTIKMRHKNIMERRVKLRNVNEEITCRLCKGYLIDATTITECLHTFCKSCIVKYLEEKNTCPKCEIIIHQSHPMNYISHDRTVQDIVYKLVPHLQENELKRQQEFYRKKGLPMPKTVTGPDNDKKDSTPVKEPVPAADEDYHRSDEQVNVCLECNTSKLKDLKRRYLRCSSHTTITHLRKFIAHKLYNNKSRFKEIDVLCNEEIVGKDHTLKFLCLTRWPYKDRPLLLNYRQRLDI